LNSWFAVAGRNEEQCPGQKRCDTKSINLHVQYSFADSAAEKKSFYTVVSDTVFGVRRFALSA
jgi:hypothetical protein